MMHVIFHINKVLKVTMSDQCNQMLFKDELKNHRNHISYFFMQLLKSNIELYILLEIRIGLKPTQSQNMDRVVCILPFHISWKSLKVCSLACSLHEVSVSQLSIAWIFFYTGSEEVKAKIPSKYPQNTVFWNIYDSSLQEMFWN